MRPAPTPALFALAVVLCAGCAPYATPMETRPARPESPTRNQQVLVDLPPPQEQVVAAVYRFRDQTGQYKPSETGASWSTAVTQGATSILMRALEDSGWFVPIEREGLSNLLNERQIIQSIRAQYEGPEGESLGPLPPLLYAGVLLEGGVVGYDTNLLTSGFGARYFGAGGSGQYRQDQVTIYLRAVSTQTGRVLKSVSTTKTIASQQMDAGIFRFVEVDRLVEAEIGYSFNEPPVVAVTEAIQEAVRMLVLEGVRDGLWPLADPADAAHPAFAALDRERDRSDALDPFGFWAGADRRGVAFEIAAGARRYQGNYRNPEVRALGEVAIRWMPSARWGIGLSGSAGEIGADRAFRSTAASGALDAVLHLMPAARTSPFFRVGVGVLAPAVESPGTEIGEDLFPFAILGGGLEHLVGDRTGLRITFANHYPFLDGLDGVEEGSGHDSIWNLSLGLAWYR